MNFISKIIFFPAATVIRLFFAIIPQSLSFKVAKRSKRLLSLLPKNQNFIFDSYLGKFKMNIKNIYGIERSILLDTYEPDLIKTIRQNVKPNMIAFDVGANVGPISFLLADIVGPGGRVFSFEPGKNIFNRFLDNIAINPETKSVIAPKNIGLADKEGELVYYELAHARGNAALHPPDGTWQPFDSHKVQVTTIDSFVKSHSVPHVDFIKIDTEGMEYEIILGAKDTIKSFLPIICFETLPKVRALTGEENFKRIEKILIPYGYNLLCVESPLSEQKATPTAFTLNTLAIPSQKATVNH